MRMRWAGALVITAACGRVGFDPIGAGPGGGGDDDGGGPIDDAPFAPASEVYLKASNNGVAAHGFGFRVAFDGSGDLIAIGAYAESSGAAGVDGNQLDTSAPQSGAVYVFERGAPWRQAAYLKASNPGNGDWFGSALAVSADGTTIAVGAHYEDSAAIGIGGSQLDNTRGDSGAVYVFVRAGGSWVQQAYLKSSNSDEFDGFGSALALSADGNTLAVAAPDEDSRATGIDGDQDDDSELYAGAVYIFARSGATWTQQAYVKASRAGFNWFGRSVALSRDGRTLAVGATGESSAATGVDGNQDDTSATGAGAVYVFTYDAGWSQQAYLKASNAGRLDFFGWAVALSADGDVLAVGAPNEDSAAVGLDTGQADNTAEEAGAAYVFARTGGAWRQTAYVKASNTGAGDTFGSAIALSASGATLAVGAQFEASAATGLDGNGGDDSAPGSGAAYIYRRAGAWSQLAYVKASNAEAADNFGFALALSPDGSTLACGALSEDSRAAGINGDRTDNTNDDAGAVYLLE